MRRTGICGKENLHVRAKTRGTPTARAAVSAAHAFLASAPVMGDAVHPVLCYFPYYYGGGGFGGGGLLIMLTLAAFAAAQLSRNGGGALPSAFSEDDGDGDGDVCTLLRLRVALVSSARSVQRDLDAIAGKADTTKASGLHFVLTETAVSLLRNPEYIVYASSTTTATRDVDKLESQFSKLSLKERSKIKAETNVNVDGVSFVAPEGIAVTENSDVGEYVVVTLLAGVAGRVRLLSGGSGQIDASSLKEAIKKLGSIGSRDVFAVEVLWTPQEEQDTLTTDEILADFPELKPVY